MVPVPVIDVDSGRFRLVWAGWMLFLGVSLFFVHTIWYVHSWGEFIDAFVAFDMPSSWCPTFMTAYGVSTLAARVLGGRRPERALRRLSLFTGLGLLPIGMYTIYEFSSMEAFSLSLWYIYPQLIHVSQFLTGLMNASYLSKLRL